MQISKSTVGLLKSFSAINNSIYLDEEGYLKTKTPNSTSIIAIAEIPEKIPPIAIYSLQEFVGSLSLFKDDIDFIFDQNFIIMEDDEKKVKYRLSDPSFILNQCKAVVDYQGYNDFDCKIELTNNQLQQIKKAAKTLNADIFEIKLKNGEGNLSLNNSELPLSNSFDMNIKGEGTGSAKFAVDNLLIIDGDYEIEIKSDKVLKFTNKNYPIFYFISCTVN